MNPIQRRAFLKTTAATLATSGLTVPVIADQQEDPAGLPTRPLGSTGQRVSIVGLGGYHIGTVEEREAIAIMHEAIDQGMTFFDNAWDYHMGGSEQVMGKALATEGRRDKVFLMTKVCDRDYEGCRKHLDDSLRRLQTDCIDLWQFHEINWDVDPDWIFEKGALKFALEARQAGKIRYIGFTGHKDYEHHLKMLAKPFDWDTVQMPLNVLDPHYRSFREHVLSQCVRRKIGAIGMKALASGVIPKQMGLSAEVCRRFALSLPISVLVCGITSREELRQDLAIARGFQPLTEEEQTELLEKTAEAGADGQLERFKTTRYGSNYQFKQHEDI